MILGALVIGIAAALPVVGYLFSVPIALGWSFVDHTPPRTLQIPVLLWTGIAAYVLVILRARPFGLAVVQIFALAAALDMLWPLATLRGEAAFSVLPTVHSMYVRAAAMFALASLAAISTAALFARTTFLYPLLVAVVVVGARSATQLDLWTVLPLLLGGVVGVPAVRSRWQIPVPASGHAGALLALLLVTVVIRMAFIVVVLRTHGLDLPLTSDDGPSYDENAWLIASGLDAEVPKTAFYFNIYVVLVAAVYAVLGHSFIGLGLIQAFLAAIAGLCVYLIAARVVDRGVALAAAAFMALDGILISLSASIGTEALAVPLLCIALLTLVLLSGGVSPRRTLVLAGIAGGLLGLIGVTRDVMLGLPIVLVPWLAWTVARRAGPRRAVGAVAVFILAAGFAYLPFSLYRDRFSFAQSYLVPVAYQLGHDELEAMGISPRVGVAGSIAVVVDRPVEVAAAVWRESWRKFDMLFFATTFGTFDPTFLVQRTAFARTAELYFLLVLVFGLALLTFRRSIPIASRVVLLALPAYGVLAHVLLFHANAATRYRALYDPVFAIAFGLGVMTIIRRFRRAAPGTRRGSQAPN